MRAVEHSFTGPPYTIGVEEELMIVIAGMELRSVRPASGVGTGDAVEVNVRPQDCLIFRATAGRLDE